MKTDQRRIMRVRDLLMRLADLDGDMPIVVRIQVDKDERYDEGDLVCGDLEAISIDGHGGDDVAILDAVRDMESLEYEGDDA